MCAATLWSFASSHPVAAVFIAWAAEGAIVGVARAIRGLPRHNFHVHTKGKM